jgi:hypothetical protein
MLPTQRVNGESMQSPNKPFDVQVEDVVDVDISVWQEERSDVGSSVEPEQINFDIDE